jgi:Domain of unknown function (DUF6285)
MQDRPSVQELLDAVRSFLEDDVVPVLDGRRRFHALVAANVLAIVGRELDGEEAALVGEWERLRMVLGSPPADPPIRLFALRAAVGELTAELSRRIRRGEADDGPFADAVRAHVVESVREKLRVANPRFL